MDGAQCGPGCRCAQCLERLLQLRLQWAREMAQLRSLTAEIEEDETLFDSIY